jgi:hypothetical protein
LFAIAMDHPGYRSGLCQQVTGAYQQEYKEYI